MAKVHFTLTDGSETAVDIDDGSSLMEGAVRGGVEGIDADCGGALACATCHVHVAANWLGRLDSPTEAELEMLSFAVGRDDCSRLSCQIVMRQDLDGLAVTVPATQH